jgi:Fe-S oxidoreductase
MVNNRKLFHGLLRAAAVASKPFSSGRFIRHLPLFLSDLTDGRSLPAIAAEPFRDSFLKIEQPRQKEKAVFYAGCLIDFAYPEMGSALVKILNKAGIEVLFPQEQTCCGAPALYSGAYEVAAQNAIDNIAVLLRDEPKYVVSACPTCTVALMHEFSKTLETTGQTKWLAKARELSERTVDFSTLITRLTDQGRLSFKEKAELGKITYHDSCHLKRTLKVSKEPRMLLERGGYEMVEMDECDTCCGMGGSYSIKLPEISAPILRRKLQSIRESGAPLVAMDCPGCVLQIRGGLDQEGSDVKIKHTAELLADRFRE